MEELVEYKIGDLVYYPIDECPFEVVGLRKDQLEIKGDFSGGTHNVIQTDWVDINDVKLYPITLSLNEMLEMSHTLGVDLFNAVVSNNRKDKILPKEFYRNRFQADNNEQLNKLCTIGCAEKSQYLGLSFYHITEKGINEYKKRYNELVEIRKDKNIDYLKNRINFYCDFYNYKFGGNNADHIISAYTEYVIKSYRVSHTTEDVINRFKTELKSYYKEGLLK